MDGEGVPAARVLPLWGTPGPTRQRHSVVTRGQLTKSKLWSGQLCQGLRGCRSARWGMASAWGFPCAWKLRGVWLRGEARMSLGRPRAWGLTHPDTATISSRSVRNTYESAPCTPKSEASTPHRVCRADDLPAL